MTARGSSEAVGQGPGAASESRPVPDVPDFTPLPGSVMGLGWRRRLARRMLHARTCSRHGRHPVLDAFLPALLGPGSARLRRDGLSSHLDGCGGASVVPRRPRPGMGNRGGCGVDGFGRRIIRVGLRPSRRGCAHRCWCWLTPGSSVRARRPLLRRSSSEIPRRNGRRCDLPPQAYCPRGGLVPCLCAQGIHYAHTRVGTGRNKDGQEQRTRACGRRK